MNVMYNILGSLILKSLTNGEPRFYSRHGLTFMNVPRTHARTHGAVGLGTVLQVGRSRVRFPMVSLELT